jgi:hypothetical protein
MKSFGDVPVARSMRVYPTPKTDDAGSIDGLSTHRKRSIEGMGL